MYYPYAIDESDENISDGISNQDMVSYDDQEIIPTHSYDSQSHSIPSIQESDEEQEEDYVELSRISNYDDVKVFLDEVVCPICFHIIINPVICKECDQSFCSKCIQKWFSQSQNEQCPCCRVVQNKMSHLNNNKSIMDQKVPKVLLKLLSKLLLTCKYKSEGCEEIITYEYRNKHENQYCLYQEQVCQNIGCYEIMIRKDLEDHHLECKYGKVQCKYCSKEQLRMDIELHLQECNYRPIYCEWCKQKYQAIDYDEHIGQCEFREIVCDQCLKKFKKYDMKSHTPIFCLRETIKKKDQKILELQKQIEFLKSNRPIEQSDLNQSTNEISSEKYKQDFEEDVEEVIEEDIQIEPSDSEDKQELSNQEIKQNNQSQQSQIFSEDENEDQQSEQDKQLIYDEKETFIEEPSIKEIQMRGQYSQFLQKLTDNQFKDLWDWTELDFKQFDDFLK